MQLNCLNKNFLQICNTDIVWKQLLEKRLKRPLKGHELQKFQNMGFKNSLKYIICSAKSGAVKTLASVTKQHKSKFIKTQENTKRVDCPMRKNTFETSVNNKTKNEKSNVGSSINVQMNKTSINATNKTPRKVENMIRSSQTVNDLNNSTRISKSASGQKVKGDSSAKNKDIKQVFHSTVSLSNKTTNSKCAVKSIRSSTAVKI